MSNSPLFPQDEELSGFDQQKADSGIKCPEFILIDERNGKSQYTQFNADASRKAENFSQDAKKPLSLRLICLFGFIFCLIFGIGMLLWALTLTCLATFSLFQNQGLNQGMRSVWKICIHTTVAGFGFTLGMLSPTLGLGLIALYFSLASNIVKDDLLHRVIRRSFSHL